MYIRKCHKIRAHVFLWIGNWIRNRNQRTGINGQFCQGGLVLFNMVISDLELGRSSELAKFVDDTQACKVVKSLLKTHADSEELQKDTSGGGGGIGYKMVAEV